MPFTPCKIATDLCIIDLKIHPHKIFLSGNLQIKSNDENVISKNSKNHNHDPPLSLTQSPFNGGLLVELDHS